MYFHKILSMNESRLTKIVYEEQKRLNFPNCWYKEVISDLKMIDINLKECQIKNLTKQQWKKIVREKMIIITENNIENMKKTKLRFIKDSKFGMRVSGVWRSLIPAETKIKHGRPKSKLQREVNWFSLQEMWVSWGIYWTSMGLSKFLSKTQDGKDLFRYK